MLPQVPIIRVTDSEKIPMPSYSDGIGTCITLRSNEMKSVKIAPRQYEIFSTGFAIALPMGMEAQIRSLKESTQTGMIVLNAPATIDASDRKEIKVCVYNASQESIIIKQGDPIAIMVFSLALRVQWVNPTKKENVEVKSENPTEIVTRPPIPSKSTDSNGSSETTMQQTQPIIEPISRPNLTEQTNEIDEIKTVEETDAVKKIEKDEEKEDITVSNENPLIEEAVAPPSILEEFEKIENEFENKGTEGTN